MPIILRCLHSEDSVSGSLDATGSMEDSWKVHCSWRVVGAGHHSQREINLISLAFLCPLQSEGLSNRYLSHAILLCPNSLFATKFTYLIPPSHYLSTPTVLSLWSHSAPLVVHWWPVLRAIHLHAYKYETAVCEGMNLAHSCCTGETTFFVVYFWSHYFLQENLLKLRS